MIKIEKSFLKYYNPYEILKNKELLNTLFDDIYKYNKIAKKERTITFGQNVVISQILSIVGLPNFVGAGLNYINKVSKEYNEKELLNYLLLYSKEKQDNIYESAALIVIFVGASAHHVASIKSASTLIQQSAKAIFKALTKWDFSYGFISMMKDQADFERQILIRINQSLYAFSMNLYFSDLRCDISIIHRIIKDFSFDTYDNIPLPIYLDRFLDYSFENNLGVLTKNKVRKIYSDPDILKQYVNSNGYKGECIDFFFNLINENKDLLAEGKFSREKE